MSTSEIVNNLFGMNTWADDQINEAVSELIQIEYKNNRMLTPSFPWVLVYVLPKENKLGSIILPENQHKSVHEAVVVSTWAPFTVEKGFVDTDGVRKTRLVMHKSELEPGAHVLFQHWTGLPVPGLTEHYFRIVKECEWAPDREGGIFATVDYEDKVSHPGQTLRDMIVDCLNSIDGAVEDEQLASVVAAKLENRFLLVDRKQKAVTISAFGDQ